MTLFDGIIIAVLAISSVLAFLRGFTSEVLSILAWVVGALAALWLFPYGTPIFRQFISPDWLAAVVSALVIFVIGYLIVAAFTARWAGHLLGLFDQAETLDKTLGLLFGLVRGLLIVTVAYLFFAWLVPNPAEQPDWIRNAKLRPLVEKSAATLFTLAPSESTRDSMRRELPVYQPLRPAQSAPAANPPAAPRVNSDADTGNAPGYNTSERKGLDRLFENAE
ncbi:MAG: CvpA family protein [Parvibaculum sp.]|uniref:CvpA family protein n=1 Tax=Parvibaculum sp. TaxID=2024848 RepID=UPI0025D55945|nr:CvpA family protein [Parvibaculum sp.]MCE9651067.1 CvpA family protein [Parvibaculum sp.]